MLSFNQDIAVKQGVIDNLKQLAGQTDKWQRQSVSWNGQEGSLIGHILQSEDLQDWENLGLPKWLAITLDYFLITSPSLEEGIKTGIGLVEAIPVGQNLQTLGSTYLVELLSHKEYGLQQLGCNPELLKALDLLVAVHQKSVQGETVAASEWRALRKQLVAITNQFTDGQIEQRIGACLEAAAWDPINSRTVVSDSVRTWNNAQSHVVISQHWSAQDDIDIKALLDKIYAAAKAEQETEEAIDVFSLLEVQYPEDATRLKNHMKLQREQPAGFWRESAQHFQTLLSKV
ncbi:hypothetical protein [Acinetobacter puyangensis]|uniref:hypothetical protein n=1 Tax=Acinetobacter puyangensis TaxID=1096779 RepID=UPI003A4DBE70